MKHSEYIPNPIDTSEVEVTDELLELVEILAKNTHNVWAKERKQQGWTYGNERNDELKITPCMTFYENLPEEEKEYDRNTAMETIKLLLKLGYRIEK